MMNPKEKILQATMKIIQTDGIEKMTVRQIAKEAEVNSAMINYYFSSKENLIDQTIELILMDARHAFDYLDREDLEPKERLKQFLIHYASVGLANPDAFRKVILKGTFDYNSQREYLQFLKRTGIFKVKETIGLMTGVRNEEILIMMAVQIMSTVIFPCLMQPMLNELFGSQPVIKDKLDVYFDLMLANYCVHDPIKTMEE